jgi:hypothetical protein
MLSPSFSASSRLIAELHGESHRRCAVGVEADAQARPCGLSFTHSVNRRTPG